MTKYKLTKADGKELREKRKNAGLSAKEVSERVRINPTILLMIERKGGNMSELVLDKLIKCYKNM